MHLIVVCLRVRQPLPRHRVIVHRLLHCQVFAGEQQWLRIKALPLQPHQRCSTPQVCVLRTPWETGLQACGWQWVPIKALVYHLSEMVSASLHYFLQAVIKRSWGYAA